MKHRPWPIVLLALFHLLAPVASVLVSSFLSDMSVGAFLTATYRTTSAWGLIDFFLLLPVAGVAIFACKRWSYPVFLLVAMQTVYSNFSTYRAFPSEFPLWLFSTFAVMDVAFVGYFLLPQVRAPYFNARLRWWETKPRYLVRFRGRMASEEASGKCIVTDISEGGCFIKTTQKQNVGDVVRLQFGFLSQKHRVLAKVVYKARAVSGYGVQFLHDETSAAKLKTLCRGLQAMGVGWRGQVDLKSDFREWAKMLLTTGKGIVPELPKYAAAKPTPALTVVSTPENEKKSDDQSIAA